MQHLHHLTITTGHTRRSWRHEIEPDALRLTGQLLADALASGGRAALPVYGAGLALQASAEGRCLVCTVWHAEAPVVTFGTAAHSRCGAWLWRRLLSGAPMLSDEARRSLNPDRAPQEPWCAARLEAGVTLVQPDVVSMLGDLERCVAWAWLDRVERRAEEGTP